MGEVQEVGDEVFAGGGELVVSGVVPGCERLCERLRLHFVRQGFLRAGTLVVVRLDDEHVEVGDDLAEMRFEMFCKFDGWE